MAFPHPDPVLIEAEVFTELPTHLRKQNQPSYWANKNRRGAAVDSFIEGPSFDLQGNLWFVDIPFGRIFRAAPDGHVELMAEYDGQPNGLKIDAEGRIFIADFKNGIVCLDPETGEVSTVLGDADTEGFKGCNDLFFGPDGALYFTDQGQTGLQDPTGRVYRWHPKTERLECLIGKVPSPNGLVLDKEGRALMIAVTRANAVWRLPLTESGRVIKAGLFLQFSGGRAGPDGLALTRDGGVVVCQTGMGLVWVHDALGIPIAVIKSPKGLGTTNCAFGGPQGRTLFITESDSGSILRAELPVAGHPMASGWGRSLRCLSRSFADWSKEFMAHETDRPWRRRPTVATPNALPRADWLARSKEAPLLPELEIVDAHHHLWDRHGFRYLLEEFAEDIGESGHNVVSSVFVQCRTMYHSDGPVHYRPLGEVEFIRGVAAQARSGFYGKTRVAQAIVGCADLLQGADIAPVLEAMSAAGGGYFKGVRLPVASHPDPAVRSNPVPAPAGVLEDSRFLAGARELARRGLSLDLWVYQTQLSEVELLARRLPDLQIVLNHAGGPLGVGPFEGRPRLARESWAAGMQRLAERPNVAVKIGGFGMPIMGFGFEQGECAPSSSHIAEVIAPYVQHCVALFGMTRCMFESNFPVDKGGVGYDTLWNAFKRIAWSWSEAQRADLFSNTARRIYRIPR